MYGYVAIRDAIATLERHTHISINLASVDKNSGEVDVVAWTSVQTV